MYDAALFDLFGTLVTERGDAIDGAARTLQRLPPARWAIVTSCPRRLADTLLERSGLPRPHVIVSSDDVQRGKPAPDGYLFAAAQLNVEPSHCVAIEDSPQGVDAARAAGMDVVNVRETPLQNLALDVGLAGRLRLRR